MEETQLIRYCRGFLTTIFISTVFVNAAKSEVYTVGDEEEWDDTGINYLKWSEKYNFSVGDVLVFKYVKGQHDAYEVTGATYQSCNASSGVLAKYKSGNDRVKLAEEKKYWFICNVTGHCLGGMRFTIDVKKANDSSNTNITTHGASSPAISLEPIPPPNMPNRCYASRKPSVGMYLVAFGILLKMYC